MAKKSRSKTSKKFSADSYGTGDVVVATVWLSFFALAIVGALVSERVADAIQLAGLN